MKHRRISRSKLAYRLVYSRSNSYVLGAYQDSEIKVRALKTIKSLSVLNQEEENRLRMVEIERDNGKANVYVPSRNVVVVV